MELVSLFPGVRPSVLTGWETNPPKPHFRWVLGLFWNSFTLYNIIYIALINNAFNCMDRESHLVMLRHFGGCTIQKY